LSGGGACWVLAAPSFSGRLSARRDGSLQTSENQYNLCARGKINIKGKGSMFTYWLDSSPNAQNALADGRIQILEPIVSGLDLVMMAEVNRPSQQRRTDPLPGITDLSCTV
jgi:hypothetical protein